MATFTFISACMALTIGFIYVSIKLITYYINFRQRNLILSDIPGDCPSRIFGHLLEYPGPNDEGLEWQRERTGRYPRFSMAWLGPFIPQVVVCHPDTVRLILKTSGDVFRSTLRQNNTGELRWSDFNQIVVSLEGSQAYYKEPKGEYAYNLMRPWVGDGLLLSKGSKWHRNRRLLTPAFHFDILRPYIVVNNQAADVLLAKVEQFSKYGEYFEFDNQISLLTLDVILQCAFSYNSDCQTLGHKHPYVQAVDSLSELATDRFLKPWLHNDFIYGLTAKGRQFRVACQFVHQVSTDIINKRKKELEHVVFEKVERKRYLDFLDILLTAADEDGEGLTDSEIRDEVDTFLFEGHDTTASAILWTVCSLAQNPEHQHLIQKELDALLKGRQSDEIVWEDLPKLTYLTMCIKEALRLHTPVSFIQRETTLPLTIDGVTIPPETLINVVLYNVHHNPTIWENSLEYQPDRFLPENIEKRDPYAFVPFSAGPRNCIGQNFAMHEIKVVLSRLLYRFSFELDPNVNIGKRVEVVVRSSNGIWVKAIPRSEVM